VKLARGGSSRELCDGRCARVRGGGHLLTVQVRLEAHRNTSTTSPGNENTGRPFTGARIETPTKSVRASRRRVAPSRGRGSKPDRPRHRGRLRGSPLHGGADRNDGVACVLDAAISRPFTGARIETPTPPTDPAQPDVAPSRGRGSKPAVRARLGLDSLRSPLHGGADRNISASRLATAATVRLYVCSGRSCSRSYREQPGLGWRSRRERTGECSWYGKFHHGHRTASGEIFNSNALTAAHRTLRFSSRVRVKHETTRREVTVRINDRGPFKSDRIVDLSRAAAKAIGLIGVASVTLGKV
jgi:rare lipoprotein A